MLIDPESYAGGCIELVVTPEDCTLVFRIYHIYITEHRCSLA
jgi:hypothetical protein